MQAADVGQDWGAALTRRTRSRSCINVLANELDRLGFEPAVGPGDGTAEGAVRIEFLHCPFRELAEAYPELVCGLHRGICAGVISAVGGAKRNSSRLTSPS